MVVKKYNRKIEAVKTVALLGTSLAFGYVIAPSWVATYSASQVPAFWGYIGLRTIFQHHVQAQSYNAMMGLAPHVSTVFSTTLPFLHKGGSMMISFAFSARSPKADQKQAEQKALPAPEERLAITYPGFGC